MISRRCVIVAAASLANLDLQRQVNADGILNLEPSGRYEIASPIILPPGTIVKGNGAVLAAIADMPANGATRQMVIGANGCRIQDLVLDGQGHLAGGVLMRNAKDWVVADCSAMNCVLGSDGAQAFQAVNCGRGAFLRPKARRAWHGIEIWRSSQVIVQDPLIEQMIGGGVWTADADYIQISGGYIADCGDVGLDFEGGVECTGFRVNITRCKNGELAFFKNALEPNKGCHSLAYEDCTARRSEYFRAVDGTEQKCDPRYGTVDFSSLSPAATGIRVQNCNLICDWGFVYAFHEVSGPQDIILGPNAEQIGSSARRINGPLPLSSRLKSLKH